MWKGEAMRWQLKACFFPHIVLVSPKQSRLTVNSELCRRDMHRSDVLIRLEPLLRLSNLMDE